MLCSFQENCNIPGVTYPSVQVWLACSPMPEVFSQQQLGAANQTHWIRSLVSVTTSLAVCRLQHVGVC